MINLVEITTKKVDTQVSRKKNKNKNINHSVFAYIAYTLFKKNPIFGNGRKRERKKKEERNQTAMVNNRNACCSRVCFLL